MKATGLLMQEHRYILRVLDVIEWTASRTARGERLAQNDVESVLTSLRFFADDHHQAKEESVLFPALLKEEKSQEYARLCRMTYEHNQQRSLVEGIEDALRARRGPDFVYYAQRLVDITRSHIEDEDGVLFKLADRMLSPEEDERLAREIGGFDSPQRKKALLPLLESLAVLELRYSGSRVALERITYA